MIKIKTKIIWQKITPAVIQSSCTVTGLASCQIPNIIYTPLIFSFNKDPSLSLPLVGMMNSSIKINSMVNDLKNLVYLQDWKAMYNDILNVYIGRDQHTIDSMNGVIMKDLPYTDIELLLPEYIYLYKCNIIDERVLNTVYPSIDSTTLLTKYGSLVDGVMVLTEDDFIYFMNNSSQTNKRFNSLFTLMYVF
jgi:hypothetical protein